MKQFRLIGLFIGLIFCGLLLTDLTAQEIGDFWSENTDGLISYRSQKPINVAWDSWFPYQYLKIKNVQSSLTGLDVELERMFAREAKFPLKYHFIPWQQTIQALEEGSVDMAAGATFSEEREKVAYFSIPYRTEDDSLYVQKRFKENESLKKIKSVDELLQFIKENNFRLGVLHYNLYAHPKINEFIANSENNKNIIGVKNYSELIEKMINGNIDGFLSDRIIASTLIWQAGLNKSIVEHYIKMQTPIHMIFSKKTVPFDVVLSFNKAISNLKNSNAYNKIFSWYLYPVIMVQTTGQEWFKLLDILGTLFFAISGVIIAVSLNQTILAAFLYAFLPSMAGFILRDVIFKKYPVEMLSAPKYLLIICIIVIIGYFFILLYFQFKNWKIFSISSNYYKKVMNLLHFQGEQILIICDALGLAALTVTGVMMSLMARADPLWLWGPFFAFVSAAFGAVIRDILSKKESLELVVGEIYSEIAIIWGLFFSLALIYYVYNITPEIVRNLIIITVSGAFFTRLFVHYFGVRNVYFR